MDVSGWIAIVAIVAGAATAILTPLLAYRFAVRQDERRWFREERARLYVDLLVEARAEVDMAKQEWTRMEIAAIRGDVYDTADDDLDFDLIPDDRMSSRDRKALGARMLAYASPDVVRKFNQIAQHSPMLLASQRVPAVEKGRVEEAFSALEQQVRSELRDGAPKT